MIYVNRNKLRRAIAASSWARTAADHLARGSMELIAHIEKPHGLFHDIKDCRTQTRIDKRE